MSSEDLGLTESVSMALGGMIGGGIYAVLGVVAQITGAATWFAFITAGLVALCAGYSYDRLNTVADDNGGSVTFVRSFTGNETLAGMIGWTLLFGYVGSMAMYAFAFAEFALGFEALPSSLANVPLRPLVSVGAVGLFLALNLLGARTTGTAENVLVALKVGILVLFGIGGLVYGFTVADGPMQFGVSELASFGPVMAAAISFVAFQGWQLLFYDQESISDPESTIRKAVYVSIPVAVVIYILVAVATYNLAPQALQEHPHVALAEAARTMLSVAGLGGLGFVIISLSALFSTGSAINATLFSSGHFAKGLLSKGLLPDRVGDGDADGLPERTLVVIAAVTAAFSAWGSLGAITSFASLAFIVVFGAMSYLAFSQRDHDDINPAPPLVGFVGAAGFFPLMAYRLYSAERTTFYMVLVISVVVVGLELLYFERDDLTAAVSEVEDRSETLVDSVENRL